MIAVGVSLILTPLVRRICERYSWLDEPCDGRRLHRTAVPRLGGVAIFATVLTTIAALLLVDNAVSQALKSHLWELLATLVPATLLFLFGVYDDLRGTDARLKFLAQGLAGSLLFAMGGRVEALAVPFIGSFELPLVISFAVTLFWVVGISNAFNLIDGMDGLAAGAALFASLVMLTVSFLSGHFLITIIALTLAGALIGFLRYNFNPATIFMGDSGSLFIGFTLAALSVQQPQKASTAVAVVIPMMAFGLPILDTTVAIGRRFVGGRPLFQADSEHIHHMLLARGWSQRSVAMILYSVCALFGMLSLLFVGEANRPTGLILLIVGIAIAIAIERLHYHEVDEIKASVRRNVSERRMRVANNIQVRRAISALSKATTLTDLFAAVREMLECSDFVYAAAQLGRGGDAVGNERVLAREKGPWNLREVELRGGMICWSWNRRGVDASEIIGSCRCWSLRLPISTAHGGWGYVNLYREFNSDTLLLDINYLCDLFQREMALAADRIFDADEMQSNEPRLAVLSGGLK